jgi:DNA replication and repair protein RecF
MRLKRLSLTNFRVFSRLDLELPSSILLFSGANAQGKTSILEAIAYLATFSSFNASSDRQLINFNIAPEDLIVGRILGEFERGNRNHSLEVRLILDSTDNPSAPRFRKQVLIDGVAKRLSALYGQFNAVTFLPQMARILEGSPADRRAYLDEILSQVQPGYARHLLDYNKALSQRNALLKILNERGGEVQELAVWDDLLARHGSQIMHSRIAALKALEELARPIHLQLTAGAEVMRYHYQPSYEPLPDPKGQLSLVQTAVDRSGIKVQELEAGFLKAMESVYREDIARGQSSLGPHRDEFRFISNKVDLGDFGSRGQGRTALLSLKFAEVQWMKEKTGEWPVLLLDEIMAELDLQRREDLMKALGQVEQAFLTATDTSMFPEGFLNQHQVWQVAGGMVQRTQGA